MKEIEGGGEERGEAEGERGMERVRGRERFREGGRERMKTTHTKHDSVWSILKEKEIRESSKNWKII